ncbi:MAG: glycosyltransferase family 39 protein [Myxococcota bacterium]|jgi:4-amino-4-deoxy-L-arabinose transferase-like glycosyltransferase|nr:glycosyltransferase family 39 protein [Myxococcota bacterium]
MSEADAGPPAPTSAHASAPTTDAGATGNALALSDRSYRVFVFAILALAAALRLWAIDFGLPHPRSRPDELVVVDLSAIPLDGKADIGWPVYPHTYIYMLAAWGGALTSVAQAMDWVEGDSYRDLLETNRAQVYLILRLLSPLLGTLAVWLAIRIGSRVFSRPVGLGAGWIIATNFLHTRGSHTIKPDVVLSVALLVALACAVALARNATVKRGLIAGAAIALAIGAKYPGVMVAPAIYLAAIMGSSSKSWKALFPRAGLAAAAATVVVFFATNPFVFLSEPSVAVWQDLARANLPMLFDEEQDHEPTGLIAPNDEQLERLARLGNLPDYADKPRWSGFTFHAGFSLRHGCGLLFLVLTPFALAWALAPRGQPRAAFSVPAAVCAIGYFALFSISPAQMSRYMTPLVPVFALLIMGMLGTIAVVAASRWPAIKPHAPLLVLIAAFIVGSPSAARTLGHNRIIAAEDTRNLATQWLAENTDRGARIKVLGTLFLPYGRPEMPEGRWGSLAPPTLEGLVEDRVGYVVTHEHYLFSSTIDPKEFDPLERQLELLVEFDPYEGGAGRPEDILYETADAYYVPTAGFENQTRPGPLVRIYRFDAGAL